MPLAAVRVSHYLSDIDKLKSAYDKSRILPSFQSFPGIQFLSPRIETDRKASLFHELKFLTSFSRHKCFVLYNVLRD